MQNPCDVSIELCSKSSGVASAGCSVLESSSSMSEADVLKMSMNKSITVDIQIDERGGGWGSECRVSLRVEGVIVQR